MGTRQSFVQIAWSRMLKWWIVRRILVQVNIFIFKSLHIQYFVDIRMKKRSIHFAILSRIIWVRQKDKVNFNLVFRIFLAYVKKVFPKVWPADYNLQESYKWCVKIFKEATVCKIWYKLQLLWGHSYMTPSPALPPSSFLYLSFSTAVTKSLIPPPLGRNTTYERILCKKNVNI